MEFQIETTEEKADKGVQLIKQSGGDVYTDQSFSVKGVEGRFSFDDGVLTINITDKPFLASWGMIEDKINQFFN